VFDRSSFAISQEDNLLMKVLGLIVARSGSKGVVGKNMKLLSGKPLLEYTIDSALEAKELTDVVLSTDSQAYAEFAVSNADLA
jgi:CMP-N-acetylneuraminic acid synthetase